MNMNKGVYFSPLHWASIWRSSRSSWRWPPGEDKESNMAAWERSPQRKQQFARLASNIASTGKYLKRYAKINDGIYFSTNTSLLYLSTNCLYFVLLRSIFFSDNFLLLLPTFKTKISYFVVNTFLKRASYFLRYICIIFSSIFAWIM